MQADTGDGICCSVVLLLEVILELFVLLNILALEGETDDERDDKDADVHPEESVHFERVCSLRLDQRLLAWVAAWEEESPGAHEEV